MTGLEFKAIRRFNGISQYQICEKLNLACRQTVANWEAKESIPNRYIIALSELVQEDLMNEKKLRSAVSRVPKNVFMSCFPLRSFRYSTSELEYIIEKYREFYNEELTRVYYPNTNDIMWFYRHGYGWEGRHRPMTF